MRFWTTAGQLFLLLCTAVAVGQAPGQPKLVLSQDSWDFGTLRHPQKTETKLTLTNAGDAVLQIEKVESSCGCTVAQPAKHTLAPGEATEMRIFFDSKGRQGRAFSKITIHSNDPAHAEVAVPVTGLIERAINLTPPHGLLFRMLKPGERITRSVRLENQEQEPLKPKIKSVSGDQYFEVELKEVDPGRIYDLVATTRSTISQRETRGHVEIETDLEVEPEIGVDLRSLVVDRVSVTPAAIWANNTDGNRLQRIVLIHYYGDDKDFRVTDVISDDPAIKGIVTAPQPSPPLDDGLLEATSITRVNLDIPSAAQLPQRGVPVRVLTNDAQYPELAIIVTPNRELFRKYLFEAQRATQRRGAP